MLRTAVEIYATELFNNTDSKKEFTSLAALLAFLWEQSILSAEAYEVCSKIRLFNNDSLHKRKGYRNSSLDESKTLYKQLQHIIDGTCIS